MNARVAVVTGAGSGIGRAVAEALSDRGLALVLAGRREPPLRETGARLRGPWEAVVCDVADPASATRLVAAAVARFGRLDVVINNAGVAPSLPVGEHTPEVLREVFAVNALGPANLIVAAWRRFEEQARGGSSGGCLVNVTSMASVDPFPGFFAYAASKAAANMLITSAHLEAPPGVRCFAVAPGAVETEMLRKIIGPDRLPRERTLSPETVAAVIVDCVEGRRDAEAGRVIQVPSP